MGWSRLVALVLVASAACGGGQTRGHPFDRAWDDESGAELRAFVERFELPRAASLRGAVAVGVVEGQAIVGASSTGAAWRVVHPAEGQPLLAGEVAVALGGNELLALDAWSGAPIWRLPALGRLRGASDDGVTTLVALEGVDGRRSQVLAVSRSGIVTRQIVEEEPVGAPVVLDEFAFLPMGRRGVLVFDLVAGDEAARVVGLGPLDRAFLAGGELYLGGDQVVRFDRAVVEARRGGGTRVALPERSLPHGPVWRHAPDGAELPRAFLLGQPEGGRLAGLAYVAGPYVVGLAPRDGATSWVDRGGAEVLAGRAVAGGVVVCERSGDVRTIDRTGARRTRFHLGVAVDRCDAEAGPLPPAERASAPLHEQLAKALAGPSERLEVELLLVDDLARLATPEARHALESLATSSATPRPLAEHAELRLTGRGP